MMIMTYWAIMMIVKALDQESLQHQTRMTRLKCAELGYETEIIQMCVNDEKQSVNDDNDGVTSWGWAVPSSDQLELATNQLLGS